jgi:hypothetical protein
MERKISLGIARYFRFEKNYTNVKAAKFIAEVVGRFNVVVFASCG